MRAKTFSFTLTNPLCMENLILCFGEILWDAFGDGKKAGGAPFNVARHLAQQQANVVFASRVGDDASGDELIDFMDQAGMDTRLIQHDDQFPTCEVTVQLDERQQAKYIIPKPVSWDNIQPEKTLLNTAAEASVIVFGSLANRDETTRNTLLDLLDESEAMRVFDVNLRAPHYNLDTIEALAAKADVIKMNEEEAALLISVPPGHEPLQDEILEFRSKYHTHTVCITRGENGALIWHDGKFYEHPGYQVQVADTVGAGDSFLATLINGLLRQQPMDQVLSQACAIGAFVASQRGANPVYDEEAIERIKNS